MELVKAVAGIEFPSVKNPKRHTSERSLALTPRARGALFALLGTSAFGGSQAALERARHGVETLVGKSTWPLMHGIRLTAPDSGCRKHGVQGDQNPELYTSERNSAIRFRDK